MYLNLFRKKELSIGLLFITSMFYLIKYQISGFTLLDQTVSILGNWVIIISAMAMGLGMFNLFMVHTRRYIQRREGYLYGLLTIVTMIITFGVALYGGIDFPIYKWIFSYLYTPGGQAFFGISFLYTCAAAYTAFRFKTIDSTMLIISGFIGMLANTPLIVNYWSGFIDIKNWITNVPAGGTFTAFKISIALGFVLISIRTIVGIEKAYLGQEA